jgi:hypothetical protein
MFTVIGTGVAIFVPLGGLLWKISSVAKSVECLPTLIEHVADHGDRLMKLETEHECCPVCRRNGKGKGEGKGN